MLYPKHMAMAEISWLFRNKVLRLHIILSIKKTVGKWNHLKLNSGSKMYKYAYYINYTICNTHLREDAEKMLRNLQNHLFNLKDLQVI